MIRILVKKQMAEIFRGYFYNAKKNKAYSQARTALLIFAFVLLMVGVIGGMFFALSMVLCEPMSAVGMDWMYFALMGFTSVFLGAFGSVFNTFSSLYLSKDNDLLLSMPIPVNAIMVSRLLSVYLMGLMYSAAVILPAIVVYWWKVLFSVKSVFGGLVFLFLISILVLILSCVLGWAVAKISLKLKNKSLMTVVLSLVFIGGYYYLYFRAQTMIQNLLLHIGEYGDKIRTSAYPVYLFGKAGTGDVSAVLILTAVLLALSIVVWLVLSRSFLNIATSSGYTERKVYREKLAKQKSIPQALLSKEFGRFLGSPNYMLNCGLGTLLLLIAGITLLWKGTTMIVVLESIFAGRDGAVQVILCALICMVISMNDMSAPSVSLEGKSIWLAQSLPVEPWAVLEAKLRMQLILTGIPTLFCVACAMVIMPGSLAENVLFLLWAASAVLFLDLLGLFLGVRMPNLTWTNETAPIKQSACVAVTMFSGFAYTALIGGLYLLTKAGHWGFSVYIVIFTGVTLIVCVLLYRWLKREGSKRFANL